MATDVSICNQALGWLGASLITSLSDKSTEAQLCNANFADLRDAVLEDAAWTFATKRYTLTPEANTPDWGYSNQFTIPAEVLRVLQVTDDPLYVNGGSTFDWRREENKILCDVDKVYLKAVIQVTDASRFPPAFSQALAARIARDLAGALTQSKGIQELMESKYQRALDTALATDGSQGKSDVIRSNILTRVR